MNTYALLIICVILTVGLAIGLAMCENWEKAIEDCDNLPIPEQKPMCLNIINNLRSAETAQAPPEKEQTDETESNTETETEPIYEDADSQQERAEIEIQGVSDASNPTRHTTQNRKCSAIRGESLSIVNVEVLKKPTRVYLTIRNNSKRFQTLQGILLRLSNKDGRVKYERSFGDISITYQKSRSQTHADSYIVLYYWTKAFRKHVRQPQERFVGVMRVDYEEGDVFTLICGETEISRYPEPVSASPQKHTRLTTLWANMKR